MAGGSSIDPSSPAVSVLMATYNGERFLGQSIDSILAQSFADFELIVVDDGSTDGTPAILAGIVDPRVITLRNDRNLGVVVSRNRAFAQARGEFVALLDHDDLSLPERLARQFDHLRAHPTNVLVATAARSLRRGRLLPPRPPLRTTPALLDWMLHVANPLVCSSVMFRAAAARALDPFLRDDYRYADDFDLYHRLRSAGDIARLDETLTHYRLHDANTYVRHQGAMTENAAKVLARAYVSWFGDDAPHAARLVSRHLAAGIPVPDPATLDLVERYLERITTRCLAREGLGEEDGRLIVAEAAKLRQRVRRVAARQGGAGIARSLPDLAWRTLNWLRRLGDTQDEARDNTLMDKEATMDEWQEKLTPEQYRVLRQHGTERPGSSPLNHEKRAGEYLCAGCNTALFDAGTKYESGSGWPSFYEARPEAVATTEDRTLGMARVEIHCARCGGHIGHVFPDGPQPSGLRFCTNGAALKFEPKEEK